MVSGNHFSSRFAISPVKKLSDLSHQMPSQTPPRSSLWECVSARSSKACRQLWLLAHAFRTYGEQISCSKSGCPKVLYPQNFKAPKTVSNWSCLPWKPPLTFPTSQTVRLPEITDLPPPSSPRTLATWSLGNEQ